MWPNLQFLADLVTFTEEILNGKLHFLCSGQSISLTKYAARLATCLQEHSGGNLNIMKMIWRNMSSSLFILYPNVCKGSWVGAKKSFIHKNFSPFYLPTNVRKLLIGPILQSRPIKASQMSMCNRMEKRYHHLLDV